MARSKTKKQQEIPGAERPTNDDIDEAIAPYVEALYARMELQVQEPALKAQVAERMKEHKLTSYSYEDGEARYVFTRSSSEQLKCKRASIAVEV